MTQLTSNSYCFLNFHIDKCSILQNSSQKTIGLTQRYNDLYVLISHHIAYNIFPTSSLLNVSTLGYDTNLWHLRLAHLSYYVYKLISVQFPLIPYNKTTPCDVFRFSKQKCLSYPVSCSTSLHMFYLVHADIWGPYYVPFIAGRKYFLTLVDDYIRFT